MNRSATENRGALYNSRIMDTYLKLLARKYRQVDVRELLAHAGLEPYEVADQGHWFTQEQVDRFNDKLVELTGNPQIAREAGRYAASSEALGGMRQFILGMMTPAKAMVLLAEGAGHLTRSASYKTQMLASNKAELQVTPHQGTVEKPFQCASRKGFIEAVFLMFNSRPPMIEHPECMFEGAQVCRYVITWEKSSLYRCRSFRNILALLLATACLIGALFDPSVVLKALLPTSVIAWLALTAACLVRERDELRGSHETLFESSETTLNQINTSYNTALMSNEIGQAISKRKDMDSILESVVHILKNRLEYDRGMVLLANQDKTRLLLRTGFGSLGEHGRELDGDAFRLDVPDHKGVFTASFREQKPYLIDDIDDIKDRLSLRSLALAKKLGVKSFICCPIVCEGESLGILAVDNHRSGRPLILSDMSLLMGIAPIIGISLRNAFYQAEKARQMRSTLMVLAASIDARDNLTAGHSILVTEYAVGIAQEMGLAEGYCEMIRVAAMLHDYGKLAVPDSILKKPGKLTAEEFEIVKTHAEKTREILEQIEFEGIYEQVPDIAAAHHEKMDGSGYPQGLTGESIPLGAKIIAVADFFEAITAKRHYRDPMPMDVALGLLRSETGNHFDPQVVEAFLQYLQKAYQIDIQMPKVVQV